MTVNGPAALALAAVVAPRSRSRQGRTKAVLARLFAGRTNFRYPADRTFLVSADKIDCRVSNVDIIARSCGELTSAPAAAPSRPRCHELDATLAMVGVPSTAPPARSTRAVMQLLCTIDPNAIKQKDGSGASASSTPRRDRYSNSGRRSNLRTCSAFICVSSRVDRPRPEIGEPMQLGKVSVAVAIWLALAAVTMPPTAQAQAPSDDMLSRDAVLRDPAIPALGNRRATSPSSNISTISARIAKRLRRSARAGRRGGRQGQARAQGLADLGPASTMRTVTLAAEYQDNYEVAHDALIGAKAKLTEAAVDDLLGEGRRRRPARRRRPRRPCEPRSTPSCPQRHPGPRLRLPGHAGLHHRHVPRPWCALNTAGFKHAIADARKAAVK